MLRQVHREVLEKPLRLHRDDELAVLVLPDRNSGGPSLVEECLTELLAVGNASRVPAAIELRVDPRRYSAGIERDDERRIGERLVIAPAEDQRVCVRIALDGLRTSCLDSSLVRRSNYARGRAVVATRRWRSVGA